jgi:hypothetical protein
MSEIADDEEVEIDEDRPGAGGADPATEIPAQPDQALLDDGDMDDRDE